MRGFVQSRAALSASSAPSGVDRVHASRPADLGLEHVADTRRDALVEQRVADRCLGRQRARPVAGPRRGRAVSSHRFGTEAFERPRAARVARPERVVAAQLDDGGVEADRGDAVVGLRAPTRALYAGRRQRARRAVHVPDAVQHHVRVQYAPSSKRTSRCLPRASTSDHARAGRRRCVGRAWRAGSRPVVNGCPHSESRSRVCPPVDGVTLRHGCPRDHARLSASDPAHSSRF